MSGNQFESTNLFPGTYAGTLVFSRLAQSVRTRNVGVTLYWDVYEPFGRMTRIWRTLWLTPGAMARSKAELARLGVRTLEDLDNDPPVPPGAQCQLVVAEVADQNGCVENRIVRWHVLSEATTTGEGSENACI